VTVGACSEKKWCWKAIGVKGNEAESEDLSDLRGLKIVMVVRGGGWKSVIPEKGGIVGL